MVEKRYQRDRSFQRHWFRSLTGRLHIQRQVLAGFGKRPTWTIGVVLLVGFSIRIWGIGFGLPYRYHIDEQVWVPFGGLLCNGQYDFPSFIPGPNLVHILLCGGDVLVFLGGFVGGLWQSPLEFRASYEVDPTAVYMAGRVTMALIGTATIMSAYMLGRRLWKKRVGMVAAVILAFTYLHVRDSHFVVSDILATFLLVAGLYLCAQAIESKSRRPFILACFIIGMSVGVKLNLIVAVLPLAVTYRMRHSKSTIVQLVHPRKFKGVLTILILPGLAGYVIGYPNALSVVLDPRGFIHNFLFELRASEMRGALWQIDDLPGWLFYPQSLGRGLGPLLAGLALIGVAYSLWRRSSKDYLLLSFVIPFFVFMASRSYYTAHYMMPLVPVLAVLASRVLVAGISHLPLARRQQLYLTALILLVVLLPSLLSIARNNYLLTQEDTRTAAKHWIEANVPADATIATSIYYAWEPQLSSDGNPQPYSTQSYEVLTLGGLGGLSDVPFHELKAQGVEYVLVSNFVYDIALRDETRQHKRDDFFASLKAESTLIHVESPYIDGTGPEFAYDQVYGPWTSLSSISRPGPSIQIFALQ